MKRKGILIVLIVLFILSSAGAAVGYLQKGKNSNTPSDTKELVKYEYYLDGSLVDKDVIIKEIVNVETDTSTTENTTTTTEDNNQTTTNETGAETTNNTDTTTTDNETTVKQYEATFDRSVCTNNVVGKWDEDKWEFVPTENKTSTCKLYFVRKNYEVTFETVNGELVEGQVNKIERGKNATFNFKAYEGYEFDETALQCSNNKEATWDKANNTLTINDIKEDIACKVVFKTKVLTLEIKLENATTDKTSIQVEYGKNISATITPNSGYEFASNTVITCSNYQTAKIENNVFKIEKLTDNTTCTVKYTEIKVVTHSFKINTSSNITITKGGNTTVNDGGSIEFTLTPKTGYAIDKVTCGKYTAWASEGNSYKVDNIKEDVTCSVTEKVVTATE